MVYSRIRDILHKESPPATQQTAKTSPPEAGPVEEKEECFWCRYVHGTLLTVTGSCIAYYSYTDYLEEIKPQPKNELPAFIPRKSRLFRPKTNLISFYVLAAVVTTTGICTLAGIRVPFLDD